jgi:hypothetical protein
MNVKALGSRVSHGKRGCGQRQWSTSRHRWLHSSLALIAIGLGSLATPALAQMGGFGFGGQAVGGISVDARGIVQDLDPQAREALAVARRQALGEMAAGSQSALRKVSLARLIAAVEQFAAGQQPLPPEALLLGGLERITHVFVDPDGHDIILAGPADAAVVDAQGNLVGAASGKPLLQLEDFLVALRAIEGARAGGMRCSIDPSPEGVARLQQFLKNQKTIGSDPEATLRSMEEVMGPQMVTVGGVPTNSRFARVLVAADYRLKRIGMGLEPSGVKGIPSYLELVPPGTASAATLPRFWLEASYDPIARDPDELAWQLSGRRMKCLTETDLFGKDGAKRGAGPTDKLAASWCAKMTDHYDELAAEQPVFAELANCVDLAVVAALIHGRQLDQRAGLDLSPLLDATRVSLPAYEAPSTIPTVASAIKKGSRWVVSASGGVQFQPWEFVASTGESADVAAARAAALAARPTDGWCWD